MLFSVLMVVVLIAAVAAGSFLAARLLQYRNTSAMDTGFQPAHYAGMHRLLDPEEVAFLRSQPGMTDADIETFTQKRRQIFRLYLRELTADYQNLHAQARELVTLSPDKNPELVKMLIGQQVRFWAAIARIECELALQAVGFAADPRSILDTVEALYSAILRATALPGPVPVA
jgi:hypothetical protein